VTATSIQIPVGPLAFDAVTAGEPDGDPVLLLHGFPESSWAWRKVQPALAEAGLATVAPDQRGYSPGANPPDAEAFAMETLVSDALAIADHLGWDTFHVVGHDWGGVVAWHLGGRRPERIRSLTAISTPHPQALLDARAAGPQPDGSDQAAQSSYIDLFRAEGAEDFFLADESAGFRATLLGSGLDAESVDHYVGLHDTTERVRGLLNWYRAAQPDDGTKVGTVEVPTMYVWPDHDAVFGHLAATTTAAHVSGPYRFEILEGVSHWAPEEAPDQVTALVLDHISSS
jgi:pimeloyl-ACP methyl ester carboxylesterase